MSLSVSAKALGRLPQKDKLSMKSNNRKFTHFELGVLHAAAILARRGEDTHCAEILGTIGVFQVNDIRARGLEKYDREPIVRVLRLERQ